MSPALEFHEISKEYRNFPGRRLRALHDFSLQVEQGEIFGFLGPNGAGKSTAIHLAMGFMLPSHGSGRLLGEPFGHAKTRRRVGFLAENVALYHRRAQRLVEFYGALNGLHGADLKTRSREALEAVGLLEHANRNVGKFSRGMLQRVGLAQSLINDPDLLILDEPTSALDPLARVTVRELLLRAREQGKTIFLSSHLLSEVELICDRVAVLHRGKLVRLGRTADLLQSTEQTEIVARGIAENLFSEAKVENGFVRFAVPSNAQRVAVEKVWMAGGEVMSLNPVRRSLEQIFLEVTSSQESGTRAGQA